MQNVSEGVERLAPDRVAEKRREEEEHRFKRQANARGWLSLGLTVTTVMLALLAYSKTVEAGDLRGDLGEASEALSGAERALQASAARAEANIELLLKRAEEATDKAIRAAVETAVEETKRELGRTRRALASVSDSRTTAADPGTASTVCSTCGGSGEAPWMGLGGRSEPCPDCF